MKVKEMSLSICTICILILFTYLTNGCEGDNSTESSDTATLAPDIPPISSMVINFDDFSENNSTDETEETPSTETAFSCCSNRTHAAFHVGIWNAFITVGLVVPVSAFIESFNHDPVLQEDGSWLWTYSVTALRTTHTAKLYGRFVNQEVHWTMYISKENDYTDFLWYSGISNLPGTEGTWALKKSPDNPVDLLKIEWHRSVENYIGDIKYTNIEPEGDENGGYIFYGITTEKPYDAYYDIYNKGMDNLVEIEWHISDREGRLKNPDHYGDSEWHYWDSNLQDTEE